MNTVKFEGQPVQLLGTFPSKGQMAPLFTLSGGDLNEIFLESFTGKKVILNIFPSLDTPICAISVKVFEELTAKIDDVVVVNVSADLPFAYKRFTSLHGIEHSIHGSFFRSDYFTASYGVAINAGPLRGLAARGVVVIGEDGKVLHSELAEEITKEIDYKAAIAALS